MPGPITSDALAGDPPAEDPSTAPADLDPVEVTDGGEADVADPADDCGDDTPAPAAPDDEDGAA